ncbi:MAG: hypothetical protein PVJ66_03830 [Gammaproteobacteria bacterium]|jgi:hypothetical protein
MHVIQSWLGRMVVGSCLVLAASASYAVSLNNTVMIPETMTWSQDLSNVTSPTATGPNGTGDPVYLDNGDGTYTYMGMDSVLMGGTTPLWDYSWGFSTDPDPSIAGSFTVTNTSTSTQTFDITFSLPISPSFTNGYMTGSLSGSYNDYDNSGAATLSLNDWDGLIDSTSQMTLFGFAGPCTGTGCSVTIAEVTDGPTLYIGDVNSTIGIHMNFSLSAGDQATFTTSFEVTPVPAPAAIWLFGSGLLSMIRISRRKKMH